MACEAMSYPPSPTAWLVFCKKPPFRRTGERNHLTTAIKWSRGQVQSHGGLHRTTHKILVPIVVVNGGSPAGRAAAAAGASHGGGGLRGKSGAKRSPCHRRPPLRGQEAGGWRSCREAESLGGRPCRTRAASPDPTPTWKGGCLDALELTS